MCLIGSTSYISYIVHECMAYRANRFDHMPCVPLLYCTLQSVGKWEKLDKSCLYSMATAVAALSAVGSSICVYTTLMNLG